MTGKRQRFLILSACFLLLFAGTLSLDSSLAAQQPPKKGAGVLIPPEPLALKQGDALSVRTLVQKPAAVNGTISWTLETRRHRGALIISALSADGKKIATGGMDGIIRVWETESGEFLKAFVGHGSYIYGLAWSPDGNTLASTGGYDGTARIWDYNTGMTLRVLKGHKGYTHHVAWARDGKNLVVAGGTSGFITLWDVLKPESVKTVETGNAITGVAWNIEGKLLAVSGVSIGVQVWDVREGKTPHVFAVPGVNGSCVAWSADGKSIAGGGATKTLVWDAESGKQKHELDSIGTAVAFSPNGESLAVSSGTGVKVWSGAFDKEPKVIPVSDARVLAWHPEGSGVYATTSTDVKLFTPGEKMPTKEFSVGANFPVQFTPGRPLFTGFGTTTPQLWDTGTGKEIAKLEGHTGGVTVAAWSRDGKYLATGAADKTVRVWEANGKPVRTLKGHEGVVYCLAWGDGKTVASGGSDKTVCVWQVTADTGKVLKLHRQPVMSVAWSKDGKQLASGDEEHAIHVWAVEAEKPTQSITAAKPVRSMAWAPNGKNLLVGVATGEIQLFAVATGKVLHTFERGGSPPGVTSLAWSNDGTTFLAGRGNHTTQVWQVGGMTPQFDLPGMGPINHVGWSAGGNSIATSETDRLVRTFDSANGQLRASLIADDKQLAVVSTTGHYRVADEATCELVYVVQTAKTQETLSPKDFVAKFRFRNNPASAVLLGN